MSDKIMKPSLITSDFESYISITIKFQYFCSPLKKKLDTFFLLQSFIRLLKLSFDLHAEHLSVKIPEMKPVGLENTLQLRLFTKKLNKTEEEEEKEDKLRMQNLVSLFQKEPGLFPIGTQ